MTSPLREDSLGVIGAAHSGDFIKYRGLRTLVRFLHIFSVFPCTSGILFSEHCAVAPWTRMKWLLLTVLEYVLILWVVL